MCRVSGELGLGLGPGSGAGLGLDSEGEEDQVLRPAGQPAGQLLYGEDERLGLPTGRLPRLEHCCCNCRSRCTRLQLLLLLLLLEPLQLLQLPELPRREEDQAKHDAAQHDAA